jgi:hypothetical protein
MHTKEMTRCHFRSGTLITYAAQQLLEGPGSPATARRSSAPAQSGWKPASPRAARSSDEGGDKKTAIPA